MDLNETEEIEKLLREHKHLLGVLIYLNSKDDDKWNYVVKLKRLMKDEEKKEFIGLEETKDIVKLLREQSHLLRILIHLQDNYEKEYVVKLQQQMNEEMEHIIWYEKTD